MRKFHTPTIKEVTLKDPVFSPRQQICRESTVPAVIRQVEATGRIRAFDLTWKEGDPAQPHKFWDSDVAKVMEGIAYSLALRKDPALEQLFDAWSSRICSAQQEDGYLNTYFTLVEKEKRFHSLAWDHELYCAGHLMEAAVASYVNLGKRELLDTMCRYADYLCTVFGKEKGKRRGWPGHPEIELALARLYAVTGKESYKELLSYFINDRGTEPNYYVEKEHLSISHLQQIQAHKPVREIRKGTGHAVRQMYLACGMADLSRLEEDPSLLDACKELFDHITHSQMYITGGIGSNFAGESFAQDYDLGNGSMMYAESCANIALVFFAIRLFNYTGDTRYLDTAERCLYNSALSGISLSGDLFFYRNYLEVDENLTFAQQGKRVPWYDCACCPTSFSRFIPQLGTFLYSVDPEKRQIALNIPAGNDASLLLGDELISLSVRGDYPYDGKVTVTFHTEGEYTFSFRIPGWCRNYAVSLNGKAIQENTLTRHWKAGDTLLMELDLPVEVIYANPKVTQNASRCALMRGPVVYALEDVDNPCPVRELVLRKDLPMKLSSTDLGPLRNVPVIEGEALREFMEKEALYSREEPCCTPVHFRAIPYAFWQNRGESSMAVWIRYRKEEKGSGELAHP